MTARVVVSTVVAALAFAAPAHAELPELGTRIDIQKAISESAGREIPIDESPMLPGSWSGGAFPGVAWMIIGQNAFDDASVGGGRGLIVLLHEWGHTTGIENEAEANCFAMAHLLPFVHAHWAQPDPWLHAESRIYSEAYGFMRAQSAVYQCDRA